MEYIRNCPSCNMLLTYAHKFDLNKALRESRTCRKCSAKRNGDKRKIKEFTRMCPQCSKSLSYKCYGSWYASKTRNLPCRSCAKIGKKMSDGFAEKLSKIMSGNGNPMFGKHHTSEVKDFISKNNRGNKSKTGQICDANTKMNMRSAAIKRIRIQGTSRSYNPLACDFMDDMNDFDFIHARNSKDEYKYRGYFADGYDKNKNIWFEYDEPHHFTKDGTLKHKDANRMAEILTYLGCRFIRYNERAKLLTEHFADGSQKILDTF